MSANQQQPTRLAPTAPQKGRTPLSIKNVQSKTQQQAQDLRQTTEAGYLDGSDGATASASMMEPIKPLPAAQTLVSKQGTDVHSKDRLSPRSHRVSFLQNLQRSKVFNNLVGGSGHLPSPSGRGDASLQAATGLGLTFDNANETAPPPGHGLLGHLRTPKKRAIPREDIHPRNVVDPDDGSPPHKKSRSSKGSGSGSAGIAVTVTQESSTTGTIASAVDKLQVDPSAGIKTPPPVHTLPTMDQNLDRHRSQTAASASRGTIDNSAAHSASRYNRDPRKDNVAQDSLPSAKNATTQRIDKISRMSATERAARDEQRRRQAENWKRKYTAEFPKMTFYLDGFDERTKGQLTRTITELGGSIEPFFSKNCTHLLSKHLSTTPNTPAGEPAQSASSASVSRVISLSRSTKRFSPSKKGVARKNQDLPLHSDRNPFEDTGAHTAAPSNGVVANAYAMGLHVWPLEKFWQIANLLFGQDVLQQPRQSKADLAQLLRHEQIHGTSERDVSAPREGWKYFDKDSIYIFIEDATREHRAIMVYQFEKPADPQAEPPWPMLYGEAENRCPFSKSSARARQKDRTLVGPRRIEGSRANSARRFESPMPPALNRSQRGASPFQQLASGNSVSVASHLTTSTMAPSTTGFAGNYRGLVGPQDKRVAQLNRRMVSAGSGDLSTSTSAEARQGEVISGPHARGAFVRSLLGMKDDQPRPAASPLGDLPRHLKQLPQTPQGQHFHPLSHRSVSLQRPSITPSHLYTPAHHGLTRSVSLGTGSSRLPNMPSQATQQEVKSLIPVMSRSPAPGSVEAMVLQLRQEHFEDPSPIAVVPAADTKQDDANNDRRPYCENCRVYFDELEEHTQSNRHRKFALNDANFAQIDALCRRVERPQAPWVPFISDWLAKNALETMQYGGAVKDTDEYSSASRSGSEDPPLSVYGQHDIYIDDQYEDGQGEGDAYVLTDQDHVKSSRFVELSRQAAEGREMTPHSPDADYLHDIDVTEGGEDSVEYNTSFIETEGHLTPQTSPEASVHRHSVFIKGEELDSKPTREAENPATDKIHSSAM